MSDLNQFYTAVVLDYFPRTFTNDDQDEIDKVVERYKGTPLSLASAQNLFSMPAGSIIAKLIDKPGGNDVRVCYPFFSHMSMPINAGEQVFVLFNNPICYWVTRKVSDRVANDPNYTHNDRSNFTSLLINGETNRVAKLFPDMGRVGFQYQTAVNLSSDYQQNFQGETVPRYTGVGSDHYLEGANNTLVLLGSGASLGNKAVKSGMIDIVAGRGQTSSTGPAAAFPNARGYTENDKTIKQNSDEGKLDLANDMSRIHVSMNMNPDTSFSTQLPSETYTNGSTPAVVAKSSKVRIIAREDASIQVEGPNGCSIVLNDNGDVYITPSESGRVFLSGPESDQEYLRYTEFDTIVRTLIAMNLKIQSAVTAVSAGAAAAATAAASFGTAAYATAAPAATAASAEAVTTLASTATNVQADTNLILQNLQTVKSKKIVGI